MHGTLNVHGTRYDLGTDTATITIGNKGTYAINAFNVDDGISITLNGTTIYCDSDTAPSGWRGPFRFEASPGDQLRIIVWDYYGYHSGLDQDINLTKPDGTKVLCCSSFHVAVPDYYYLGMPYQKTIQLDKTITIP